MADVELLAEQYRAHYLSDPINYVYGAVGLLSFILGTTLNFVSLCYFINKPKHLSTIIYISIIIIDLIICTLSLPISLSYLSHRAPVVFSSTVVCQVCGVLWNGAARMSVFLVAVLSMTRTFQLRYPFRIVQRRLILALICGYGALQMLQSTIPYWFGVVYKYYDSHIQCQWFFEVS